MPRTPKDAARPAGPAPNEAKLYDAALAHIARFATTRTGLVRVLDRRVDRWARAAEAPDPQAIAEAKKAVRRVAERLVALGAIDDAAFAASRARRLSRAGRSRIAVAAHLAARGIAPEAARAALPDDPEMELAAALVLARKRRIGPFRAGEADAETQKRELGILARAGFGQDIASRALRADPETAEEIIIRQRRE
jgi:regulatory protein